MKNKVLIWGIGILMLIVMSISVLGIGCTYTTVTGGTDYFGVNKDTVNTTTMTSDQSFGSYTFFTPRLNFTKPVNDTLTTGGAVGGCVDTGWSSYLNVTTSLVLLNGSNTVAASNYTFAWLNQSAGQWCINFTDARYSTTSLKVLFNRTFVKNVDDLIVCPACIRTGPGSFLVQNTPATYGDAKTFRFDGTSNGVFLNDSNWAVGWTYTQRTCTGGTNPDAIQGISGLKVTLFAAFGLLAVLLLAIVAFAVIKLLQGGADLLPVAIVVISGAIVLFIAYIIISLVATALGA